MSCGKRIKLEYIRLITYLQHEICYLYFFDERYVLMKGGLKEEKRFSGITQILKAKNGSMVTLHHFVGFVEAQNGIVFPHRKGKIAQQN